MEFLLPFVVGSPRPSCSTRWSTGRRLGLNRTVAAWHRRRVHHRCRRSDGVATPYLGDEVAYLHPKGSGVHRRRRKPLQLIRAAHGCVRSSAKGLTKSESLGESAHPWRRSGFPSVFRAPWSDSQAIDNRSSLFSVVTPIVTIYCLLTIGKRLIAAIDGSIPVAQRETVRALAGELDDTIWPASCAVKGRSASIPRLLSMRGATA